mmetsp:Transcript_42462/g.83455  ORF Transcript_42462/g.83455 Transcript_42462/m.83455 type:complete len:258 (-) Transcript_42462:1112-1885(-)
MNFIVVLGGILGGAEALMSPELSFFTKRLEGKQACSLGGLIRACVGACTGPCSGSCAGSCTCISTCACVGPALPPAAAAAMAPSRIFFTSFRQFRTIACAFGFPTSYQVLVLVLVLGVVVRNRASLMRSSCTNSIARIFLARLSPASLETLLSYITSILLSKYSFIPQVRSASWLPPLVQHTTSFLVGVFMPLRRAPLASSIFPSIPRTASPAMASPTSIHSPPVTAVGFRKWPPRRRNARTSFDTSFSFILWESSE